VGYTSFKEQWVRSVAGRTEEGLILPSPWMFGARREYRLSATQTNEVIERVGYSAGIVFLIFVFGSIALAIVIATEVHVWYVAAAVFVVWVLGLLILAGGLIYGITYPVLGGLSWTKAAPEPRKNVLEVLWNVYWTVGADFSTPLLIFFVLASFIVLSSNVRTIYGSLVSGRISWVAVGFAALVLPLTIQFCRVLLARLKAWWAEK
jgi:hypothetical protein